MTLDCKTVGFFFFLKIIKEIGKAWRKSLVRASHIILLHEKFLQFDWLRAVVFQLNLKYLLVKITNLLRVVV